MKNDSKILISGAGIAGLTCALWLAKKGYSPVVVERADSIRAGGFLVSLAHHAYQSADQLGVMPQLLERSCGITGSSYHDTSGRTLLRLDSQALFGGVELIQILRDDLVDVLHQNAKEQVEIRFSDSIEAMHDGPEGVDVEFQSGRREQYDLVIGADGLHSKVRELAFPADSIIHHYLDLRCAAFRLPNVIDIQNKFETHMQRDRYMAIFSSGHGDLGAVFIWDCKDRSVPVGGERRGVLLEAFRSGDDSTLAAVNCCPKEHSIFMDSLQQIEAKTWSTDRVVLIGDSAHSLTPFSGRGAAAAVNGATRLAHALGELPITEAFSRYESEMRPVINSIQPATRRAVRWYVPRNPFTHLLRDNAMRMLPNALFRAYFQMKYSNI